jgi:hypothetical protein
MEHQLLQAAFLAAANEFSDKHPLNTGRRFRTLGPTTIIPFTLAAMVTRFIANCADVMSWSPISGILFRVSHRSTVSGATTCLRHTWGGLLASDSRCVCEAKEQSFSDFIRSSNPDIRHYIANFHYRQLYRSPWEMATGPHFLRWMIQARISMMHWFYVAEFPDLSLRFFQKAFPEAACPRLERANVSTYDPTAIEEDDSRFLLALNRLDMAIYTHAVNLLQVRTNDLSR